MFICQKMLPGLQTFSMSCSLFQTHVMTIRSTASRSFCVGFSDTRISPPSCQLLSPVRANDPTIPDVPRQTIADL
jgi:hypothetical protein